MQTFLISNDYAQCARVLDNQRLSRQITEACQLAKILHCYRIVVNEMNMVPTGITFPPAVKLWVDNRGLICTPELREYTLAMNMEWYKRTKNQHKSWTDFSWVRVGGVSRDVLTLQWPNAVYESHMSNLLRKDFSYYARQLAREGIMAESIPPSEYAWYNPIEVTNGNP